MIAFFDFHKILDFGVPGIIFLVIVLLLTIFLITKFVYVSNRVVGKIITYFWMFVKWGSFNLIFMILAVRLEKFIFYNGWMEEQVERVVWFERLVNETFWNVFQQNI